mmetsp:Transcript_6072/g.14847  ORF Transcript_6072/g.14847 Transcript_6072/m.14847 type:complete len:82 (+) Transcript_6072:871-1116(+)
MIPEDVQFPNVERRVPQNAREVCGTREACAVLFPLDEEEEGGCPCRCVPPWGTADEDTIASMATDDCPNPTITHCFPKVGT